MRLLTRWPVLVALMFGAYAAALLFNAFQAQAQLRSAAEARVVADSKRVGILMSDVLADRMQDAAGLAELPEIRSYLANKSLGMSGRYGLDANLGAIEAAFHGERSRQTTRGGLVSAQIAFYDEEGRLLAEMVPGAPPRIAPAEGPASPQQSVDRAAARLVTTVPVIHKDTAAGTVVTVAELAPLTRSLIASDTYRELLLTDRGEELKLAAASGLGAELLRRLAAMPAHTPVPIDGGLLAINSPVAGAGLTVVSLLAAADVYNHLTSRPMLYAACAVPLLLLLAALMYERMRSRTERLQFALDGGGECVWEWEIERGRWRYSPGWLRMLGLSAAAAGTSLRAWEERIHPDDRHRALAELRGHLGGTRDTYDSEHRVRTGEGRWLWVHDSGIVARRTRNGAPATMVGTCSDIGERKQVEASLLSSEQRLRTIYNGIGEALLILDLQADRILDGNDRVLEMFGCTREALYSLTFASLGEGTPMSCAPEIEQWASKAAGGTPQSFEWRARARDGREFWVDVSMRRADLGESEDRLLVLMRDISERKESEETIWRQANFDGLTGLPNRRMFHARLEQEIRQSRRTGTPMAVMFLDLDRFKEINDTLGHHIGDVLLLEAARRVGLCVRESDLVARLGGDEFTVVLTGLQDLDGVDRAAQAILDKLSEPFELDDERVYITASIGITLYPRDAADAHTLLKQADQAMYAAKAQGRNRFSHFTPSMQTASQSRLRLAGDLRAAIGGPQFRLLYQPIVDLRTGALRKAEALLRWQHPARGAVSPSEFIPVAEETGLIVELGDWVFRETARQVQAWQLRHGIDLEVSFNVSPVQFHRMDGLQAQWARHLREIGLPQRSLTLEITEGLLLDANQAVTEQLLKFRDAGLRVAIDDFGTGYSSLSYLKKFTIDYLKIDQSFVRNLSPDSEDMTLCEAIIAMAHKLGIQVIAEGVESEAQQALLARAGCDFGQGYALSRPLEAQAFDALLARRAERPARPAAAGLGGAAAQSATVRPASGARVRRRPRPLSTRW
ncbi:EAL domain-containing protein [Aquincola sp. MAHUQ-54]|uniref:EAL domain-containing protein n=1 Tax=Aquincola agrisoli TaxID=3119538 RepID=A0AAW9QB26_9BURK